jgi:hypothetical protein
MVLRGAGELTDIGNRREWDLMPLKKAIGMIMLAAPIDVIIFGA